MHQRRPAAEQMTIFHSEAVPVKRVSASIYMRYFLYETNKNPIHAMVVFHNVAILAKILGTLRSRGMSDT